MCNAGSAFPLAVTPELKEEEKRGKKRRKEERRGEKRKEKKITESENAHTRPLNIVTTELSKDIHLRRLVRDSTVDNATRRGLLVSSD